VGRSWRTPVDLTVTGNDELVRVRNRDDGIDYVVGHAGVGERYQILTRRVEIDMLRH
jgi:hypothetical protein